MTFKHFAAQPTGINNFLMLLPGSYTTKNMTTKELNDILFHTVTNGWERHSYLQGWGFEMKTYRETCAMFKQMEIAEQVYVEKNF